MPRDARKINFIFSLLGVFGSLFFSEILKYPPCPLCWYQRIALYPLAVIYAVAILADDKSYRKYVVGFILFGLTIAIYHNLLYYGVIAQPIIPCTGDGVSCTARQLELFGVITIPLLSLVAFSTMGLVEWMGIKCGGQCEK